MSVHEHKQGAPASIRVYVLTVSDTRTVADDKSGQLLRQLLEGAGHVVVGHEIVKDELTQIQAVLRREVANAETQAVILTGGTGISPRDVSYEAMKGVLEKELTGYGELFRMLSYQEIGAAAMLSRAIAGVTAGKLLIATPGSSNAVRLAMEKLILPEIGHLVREANKGR